MMQKIIKEAGKILQEGYWSKKEVYKKGSVDLLTEYDIKIEEFLSSALQELYPDYTIIGEESAKSIEAKRAIYIDPIDGTTNFVHHIAYTAISVGVWEDGKPVEGVVYNPILEEFFYAKRGEGAFLNGNKIEVSKDSKLINALLATGFPYTKTKKGKDFDFVMQTMANLLPITRDIRRLGSASIDLAYVACGRFGGFYEVNLKPWDVAAGILLVEEAGGRVSNHKGEPYRFGDIIVASNGAIHDALIEHMSHWN